MNTLYKEISRCRVTFLKTTETTLKCSTISVISNLWWEKNDTSGEQLGGFYLYLWQPNHSQCFNQKDVFFPKTNQSISTVMSLHTQRKIKPKEDWSCKIKQLGVCVHICCLSSSIVADFLYIETSTKKPSAFKELSCTGITLTHERGNETQNKWHVT